MYKFCDFSLQYSDSLRTASDFTLSADSLVCGSCSCNYTKRAFFCFLSPPRKWWSGDKILRAFALFSLSSCVCVCVCMICLFPTRLTSSLESFSHGLEYALYRAPASLTCMHLSLLSPKESPPIVACCFISHSDQICVGSFFFFLTPARYETLPPSRLGGGGGCREPQGLEKLDENAVRGTKRKKKISPLQITPNCPPQISSRACSCS